MPGDHGRRADEEEGDGVALGSSTCGGDVPLSRGVAVVSARLRTHVPTWRRRSCCVLACMACRAATTASIGGEGGKAGQGRMSLPWRRRRIRWRLDLCRGGSGGCGVGGRKP